MRLSWVNFVNKLKVKRSHSIVFKPPWKPSNLSKRANLAKRSSSRYKMFKRAFLIILFVGYCILERKVY